LGVQTGGKEELIPDSAKKGAGNKIATGAVFFGWWAARATGPAQAPPSLAVAVFQPGKAAPGALGLSIYK
jgi:hypothetical protein